MEKYIDAVVVVVCPYCSTEQKVKVKYDSVDDSFKETMTVCGECSGDFLVSDKLQDIYRVKE